MDDKSSDKIASTQKSLPSTYDPGWNDTPKWACSYTQNSCTVPAKRILNKRVPFPLTSAQSASPNANQVQNTTMNVPPPMNANVSLVTVPHSPLVAPSDVDTEIPRAVSKLDKEETLTRVLENLEVLIKEHVAKNKVEDVQKRLDLMKELWLADKLEVSVCQTILDISQALKERDVEKADKLHVMLMVNHTNVCSSWISSVRHLISELKEKQQHPNVSQIKNPL